MGILPAWCLCTTYVLGACGDRKMEIRLLDLKVQTAVCCHGLLADQPFLLASEPPPSPMLCIDRVTLQPRIS